MAAKFKKRLCKVDDKLLKLETLELKDVLCAICQSILIEPVTLPCYHDFCKSCFTGTIENNTLCCPLCRLRIGSWLRASTKQKSLVNITLWNFLKYKFPVEIDAKNKGEDVYLPEETPILRLSAPGEIRAEYEEELIKLRHERLRIEEQHLQETEILIKKIQEEEEKAHERYLERLKQDELLALQLQKHRDPIQTGTIGKRNPRTPINRLKSATIDGYLSKISTKSLQSTPGTRPCDNFITTTKGDDLVMTTKTDRLVSVSPEIVPGFGNRRKDLDKKPKSISSIWNKENGNIGEKEELLHNTKDVGKTEEKMNVKTNTVIQSLPVSLPYTGILLHKVNAVDTRRLETGSVDSMRQELCYFKPIDGKTPTSMNTGKTVPIRVPGLRVNKEICPPHMKVPSRAQYIEGLSRLRSLSLKQNLPSAFVIALSMLRVKQETSNTLDTVTKTNANKSRTSNNGAVPVKKNIQQHMAVNNLECTLNESTLRRTRSMGSIAKEENETTPKKSKVKVRKVSSERKSRLRSSSKKLNTNEVFNNPPLIPQLLNNNKVHVAVKNLSSPFENCNVKKILEEQLRIEKLIEQEKNDFELAQKMQADWNGKKQKRVPVKRQVTLNYALRPSKKLKV